MATLSQWQPYDQYVQGGMVDGRFMSAAFTLLAAGPPRLSAIGGVATAAGLVGTGAAGEDQIAYPIGLVQQWSLGQNMNLARFFELGSSRSYFIPGRTVGQLSLARVMYHGPSLLRVLYAYYSDIIPDTVVDPLYSSTAPSFVDNQHDVMIPPGYENVYLNLASDLFSQPIGLMLIMKDSNESTLAAYYFESCYIPSHQIGTDAMGVVIQESVSVQYERVVPINVAAVSLITGIT
jgi:hypothetical protein